MRYALPLYAMVTEVSFIGMVLVEGALSSSEVMQRIMETMEPSWDNTGIPLDFVHPMPGTLRCSRNRATLPS